MAGSSRPSARERTGAGPVEALALVTAGRGTRELFGGEAVEAVGRRVGLGVGLTPEGTTAEVIGVVGDVLFDRPSEGTAMEAFFSLEQEADRQVAVLVRGPADPLALVEPLRTTLSRLDPSLPLHSVSTLESVADRAVADTRLLGRVVLGLALLGTMIAATGVWAVVASLVAHRRRELGIRMALGADLGDTVATVLRPGLSAAAAGLALGALIALAATRLLDGLLFEVPRHHPGAWIAGAVLLLGVSTASAWLPARRAAGIDPSRVLRD